ncbi:MAG: hypothetical protein HUK26_02115 [Duodenibacillus sp.]|nr:hypothetical protein [Duodenibacillus sp.]
MAQIKLTGAVPLGTGAHRSCYRHPDDPGKCVKVVFDVSERAKKLDARELRYYRHLARTLKDWSGLTRYYGPADTDLGPGEVFELVACDDGSAARTLKSHLEACDCPGRAEELHGALRRLRRYIIDNRIVTLALGAHNVLLRERAGGGIEPVICDNIGDKTALSPSYWLAWECRRQQDKRWRAFMKTPPVAAFLARWRLPEVD